VTVSLVGAGPGDPGLLTRRGAELLGAAEVVVYDRLIGHELLELAPPGATLINVGKAPGASSAQPEINAQLIEHGRAGRRVVRLKGGDPFVFGRGGEEAEALRTAGVDYEVVPGVSSAFAAPGAAGIPVTHRGMATSVTVVTGHVGDGSATAGVDWHSLGRAGGTLVILMGMSERAEIAAELIGSGRPVDTPVAVVHWGTTPRQQVVRSTLARLTSIELPAPSVIVVGPVAELDLGTGGPGSC
jgi:uroporphyrinogen III methyltransferase / synthase